MPYIGRTLGQGTRSRFLYTATAGQTTFSGSDTQSNTLAYSDNTGVDCFQNGVLLKGGGADYTATSGTSVVLTTGASVSDVIEILVYDVFAIADHVKKSGDAMTGALTNIDVNGTELILDADGDTSITADTDDRIDFKTSGSDIAHVTSTGLGVGITSLDNTYSNSRAIQLASVGDNNWGGTVMLTSADGSTVFSRLVASTDGLDLINTKSTNIRFFTSNSERMRIDSSGSVLIGATSNPGGGTSQFIVSGQDTVSINNTSSGTGTAYSVYFKRNATGVGSITVTGSATAYNTSSDHRLKENIVTDWDATTRLKQLKPSRFNFKADADTTVDGFLAHEVSSIVPEAITGEKDAVDLDGNIQPQAIDQSKLVPLLTKALQEAVAKIETLEAKVTALEGN